MSPEKEVEDKKRLLLWGVLPGAIAWFSLINTGLGFLIQMLAFIFSYHVDKKLYAMWGVPEWDYSRTLSLNLHYGRCAGINFPGREYTLIDASLNSLLLRVGIFLF